MKYLTFPIAILKEHPDEMKEALNNTMDYCLFAEYLKDENLSASANRLGITFHDLKKCYQNGKMIYESISDRAPKTSVKKDLIFEFYQQEKTEFQKVCFLAYCALRSIIQKQAYTKASNDYLLNRMAGNNSKGGILPQWLMKYTKRYWLDKIKIELQLNFGLKYEAENCRGFWFSFSLDLTTLITIKLTKGKKGKEQRLADRKKDAREKAIKIIQSSQHHSQHHSQQNDSNTTAPTTTK